MSKTFAEKIEEHIDKKNILSIGEVKLSIAYLYSKSHEVVLKKQPHGYMKYAAVVHNKKREVVFDCSGSLRGVLNGVAGFIICQEK